MEKKLRKMKKAVAVTLAVVMSLISADMAALAEFIFFLHRMAG